MSKEITITAHELARKLLEGPDLPVFRYPVHDENWEEGHLVPLSHVDVITPQDIDGNRLSSCVVVDTALA